MFQGNSSLAGYPVSTHAFSELQKVTEESLHSILSRFDQAEGDEDLIGLHRASKELFRAENIMRQS